MATPARVQEVRYDVPQQSPWLDALEGAVQVGGGMLLGKYQRERQQQEDMMKLLPVLAQMRMLQQGGTVGQPGVMNVPGLGPMRVTSPAPDQQEMYYKAKTDELMREMGEKPMLPAQAQRLAVNEVNDLISKDSAWQFALNSNDQKIRSLAEQRKDSAIAQITTAYLDANTSSGSPQEKVLIRKKGSQESYGMTTRDQLGDPEDREIEYQDKDGNWYNAATKKPVEQLSGGGVNFPAVGAGGYLAARALAKKGAGELAKKIPLHPSEAVKSGIETLSKTGLTKKAMAGAASFAPWAKNLYGAAAPAALPAYLGLTGLSAVSDYMMNNPATANLNIGRPMSVLGSAINPLIPLLGTPEGRAASAHPFGYLFNSQYRNDPINYLNQNQ